MNRCLLLALKMKDGAGSQELQKVPEPIKDEETDFPLNL